MILLCYSYSCIINYDFLSNIKSIRLRANLVMLAFKIIIANCAIKIIGCEENQWNVW